MSMKKIIATDRAPGAIGPYSQAVEANGFLYTSGQLPIDPATGTMPEGIKEQTAVSLGNVMAILESRGLQASDVIKTLVFLKDMNQFADMNGVYQEFFSAGFPARSCVEVARLPKDALVEIEVIAAVRG